MDAIASWTEQTLDSLDFEAMTDEQAAEIAQQMAEAQEWLRLEEAIR